MVYQINKLIEKNLYGQVQDITPRIGRLIFFKIVFIVRKIQPLKVKKNIPTWFLTKNLRLMPHLPL